MRIPWYSNQLPYKSCCFITVSLWREELTGYENHCKGIFLISSASGQRTGRTYSREHSLVASDWHPLKCALTSFRMRCVSFQDSYFSFITWVSLKSVTRNQELTESSFYSINLTQMQYIVITVQVDWVSCEITECLFYSILCCACIALLLPFSRWEHAGMQKAGGLLKDMRICLHCS